MYTTPKIGQISGRFIFRWRLAFLWERVIAKGDANVGSTIKAQFKTDHRVDLKGTYGRKGKSEQN